MAGGGSKEIKESGNHPKKFTSLPETFVCGLIEQRASHEDRKGASEGLPEWNAETMKEDSPSQPSPWRR